ncbi:MAG TPA: PAS domain S-box protein, partial [Desulfurivibrio alkaliphilus]|nr:PAS domain S-box protein [Desulfurivibrio alkaliphilus]
MPDRSRRRTIIALVWVLVSIGLLTGVLTNGLVGWTLLTLNRERVQLLEQDRHLGQLAARLQRLGQESRRELNLMLLGGAGPSAEGPVAAFASAVGDLRAAISDYPGIDALGDLDAAVGQLTRLHQKSAAWLERYRLAADDQQEKITLGKVRLLLEEMRAAAETLEGRQRLAEAMALRRWRQAATSQSPALAQVFLEQHLRQWPRVLKEVRGELGELSRLVEILVGEDQFDHLADLRDNQLKQVLERLERQLLWLAEEGEPAAGLEPGQVAQLRELLFGRGHRVLAEYQTIQLGEGGLYRLSSELLLLRRERELLQRQTQELFARIERFYPVLADLAGERSAAITRQAENLLSRGLFNLMLLSMLVLVGFLALGWLISSRVENQVRSMARLRRHNELILNSAGEGILGLEIGGKVTFINPAGARLLGGAPADLIGRCFGNILIRPENEPGGCGSKSEPLGRVFGQGLSVHVDNHRFQRLDGSSFPGEYTANPIRNEGGEIEGAVITFLDVTERKQAAAALQQTCAELDSLNRSLEAKVAERTRDLVEKNQELLRTQKELVNKEKLAAVGSLAAGVAHEINNPAAIIRGNVEILRRRLDGCGGAGGTGQEEVLEIIRNIERISRITQGLLLFAREQSQPPAPAEAVRLNELLAGIVQRAAHQVPLAGVRVEQDFVPDLPMIKADQEKLRQVFTNLVINAVQAMEGRGRLRISTARAGDFIEVEVEDSGPGIPPGQRNIIFNPFFTTKKTGAGLGLAISYG